MTADFRYPEGEQHRDVLYLIRMSSEGRRQWVAYLTPAEAHEVRVLVTELLAGRGEELRHG